ncbi:MAG: mechanosensitive ion channel protein MscS [Deltaproteobacteria bacterium HGW-Deltaproteobacteria-19]|jgi:small-conductance mechanosensitive channel|nr:MAG: mechanosensitive ion channel protein MscS [Deltaproteobacteria bacterium HGW-Deltaproteobacteria-19]
MTQLLAQHVYILPLLIMAAGIFCGIAADALARRILRRIIRRTGWESGNILVMALRRMGIYWFTATAAYAAIHAVPLSAHVFSLLEKGILVLVILSVTFFLARLTVGIVNLYSSRAGGVFVNTTLFANISKAIILLLGILVILQTLGISITPVLTALGVGGLAAALALQDTLSNLFSGIQIIASRQIRPGDYVKLASGEEGVVHDITWRSTTLRATPNNMIVIPNAELAKAKVTNFDLESSEMNIVIPLGVSYDSELERVEKITLDVAKEVLVEIEGGVPEFEPLVRYVAFGDSSINFSAILRVRTFTDQFMVRHEFIKRLHRRYREDGVEIPFPIRTIYMKGGEADGKRSDS